MDSEELVEISKDYIESMFQELKIYEGFYADDIFEGVLYSNSTNGISCEIHNYPDLERYSTYRPYYYNMYQRKVGTRNFNYKLHSQELERYTHKNYIILEFGIGHKENNPFTPESTIQDIDRKIFELQVLYGSGLDYDIVKKNLAIIYVLEGYKKYLKKGMILEIWGNEG